LQEFVRVESCSGAIDEERAWGERDKYVKKSKGISAGSLP